MFRTPFLSTVTITHQHDQAEELCGKLSFSFLFDGGFLSILILQFEWMKPFSLQSGSDSKQMNIVVQPAPI